MNRRVSRIAFVFLLAVFPALAADDAKKPDEKDSDKKTAKSPLAPPERKEPKYTPVNKVTGAMRNVDQSERVLSVQVGRQRGAKQVLDAEQCERRARREAPASGRLASKGSLVGVQLHEDAVKIVEPEETGLLMLEEHMGTEERDRVPEAHHQRVLARGHRPGAGPNLSGCLLVCRAEKLQLPV